MVKKLIQEEGIDARITETSVQSIQQACHVQFIGSPSLRVQGKDIDPDLQHTSHYTMA
jgi:hypothetical protein